MNVKPADSVVAMPGASRRRWLVSTGAVTLAGGLALAWWQRQPPAGPAEPGEAAAADPQAVPANHHDTLRAWVDTLLPADGAAPGALATGVVEQIVAAARSQDAYRRLLTAGLDWLDGEARGPARADARDRQPARFAALGSEAREAIAGRAAAAAAGSTPRVFFQATLDDTHYHHWADPRSWPALGYAGPPQPAGFTDHGEPPRG